MPKNYGGRIWQGILIAVCLLISLAAHAESSVFTTFIDRDHNPATGCNFNIPGGSPVTGAEFKIDVVVNIATPPAATATTLSTCAGGTFGPPAALAPLSQIGLNIGIDGSDIMEFSSPLAALGSLILGDTVNLAVVATNGQGQFNQLNAPNVTIPIPNGSVPIPTLSFYAAVLLTLVLLGLAWRYLPRSGWPGTAAAVLGFTVMAALAANFIVDGLIPDWQGVAPIATTSAPNPSVPSAIDVRQTFIGVENGTLFFRNDVANLELPTTLTVTATVDNPVIVGQTVALVGTAQSSGTITAYQWTQTAGPAVTLTNPTQATATFVAPTVTAPTVFTFTLTVNDSNGKTTSTSVSTTVNPVATLTVSATATSPVTSGQTTPLVGVAQSSGTVTTYQWSQTAGPTVTLTNGNQATAAFVAPTVTTLTVLTFKLEVADSNGQTAAATVSVTVMPVATLTVSATATSPISSGGTASLAGTARSSGTVTSYQWSQTAGVGVIIINATQANATFIAPPVTTPTVLTFKLEVADSNGQTAATTVNVTIKPVVNTLSAVATAATTAKAGQTVSLVGSAQSSGTVSSYQWTQTAGPAVTITNATQANATFVAPSVTTPTVLTFTLTVTDSNSKTTSSTVSTTINPVVNLIVEALGGPRQAITGDTVSLHAQCTGATTPIYAWTQVSPATPAVALTNANTENPTFTAPSVAQYTTFTFHVECTDATDLTQKATANSVVYVNYATPTPGGPGTVNAPTVVAVPPQVLRLLAAPPSVTVVGGQAVKLSVPATGGTQPYTWTWTQTAGPTVTPSVDPATGVATVVTLPVTTQQTLTYQLQVTDSTSPTPLTQTATVSVTVIPTPTLQPLMALVPTTLFVDEGKPMALWAQPQGGNGSYLYNWVYVPSNPSIVVTLADANTSHATFTAPAVTATTQLRFNVTISDTAGNGGGTLSIFVQVNDLAPTLNVATASDVAANSGDATVSLNFPKPKGGVGPYTYAIAQTAGPPVTLSSATARTATFTAPTLAAGAADATLTFVMTVTDSLGNQTQATENVVIQAPQAVPLAATLTGPASADQGATISLNASATGGVGTYAYSYAVTGGTLTIPATANPSVTLPALNAGDANLALTITVTVTDSATPANTATATLALTVNAPPAPQVSAGTLNCVQCGEPEFSVPCSSMELLFDTVTLCGSNPTYPQPAGGASYCMTDAATDSDGVTSIYKRCVDRSTCHTLWYLETSDQNVCRNFDGVTTDVSCHFCYIGDGSNVGGPNNPESTGFPLYNGH